MKRIVKALAIIFTSFFLVMCSFRVNTVHASSGCDGCGLSDDDIRKMQEEAELSKRIKDRQDQLAESIQLDSLEVTSGGKKTNADVFVPGDSLDVKIKLKDHPDLPASQIADVNVVFTSDNGSRKVGLLWHSADEDQNTYHIENWIKLTDAEPSATFSLSRIEFSATPDAFEPSLGIKRNVFIKAITPDNDESKLLKEKGKITFENKSTEELKTDAPENASFVDKIIAQAKEKGQTITANDIKLEKDLKAFVPAKEESDPIAQTAGNSGYSVALYYDLSINYTVRGVQEKITEIDKPAQISIDIPKDLQQDGRQFIIYRIHDGKVDEVGRGTGSAVTIETDKFSTYALAYKDTSPAPVNPVTPVTPTASPAADTSKKAVEVFRLYNPSNDEHLYTTDLNEYKVLKDRGWNQEGIAWYAPSESSSRIYRLAAPGNGNNHLYTNDTNEYKIRSGEGWTTDQTVVMYSDDAKTVKITRLYNTVSHQHLLTTDQREINALTAGDWIKDAVEIYAVKGME